MFMRGHVTQCESTCFLCWDQAMTRLSEPSHTHLPRLSYLHLQVQRDPCWYSSILHSVPLPVCWFRRECGKMRPGSQCQMQQQQWQWFSGWLSGSRMQWTKSYCESPSQRLCTYINPLKGYNVLYSGLTGNFPTAKKGDLSHLRVKAR